ncbi:MAG: RNA 2',3'-cyclic phosphodiesterase [Candidatus Methanoperedens sp.]|nr:RNA 2',3'-cyclic phosphodiesterase [Candidatus Methanoperedens sp.]
MIRTFIAVELPEKFLPEIESIGSQIKIPGVKLVEPGLVHITMKFLGDIHEDKIESIASALSQIKCKPFEASIKGIGVFPKLAYVKVIWLGGIGDFENLHSEVESVLSGFKFKQEDDFTPHATIARVKQPVNRTELMEKIKNIGDPDLGKFWVSSIYLKKSTLTPRGPIYETLKEIKLSD